MAQHRVADGVAVGVVDALEVVGVDQHQRQRPRRTAPALQFELAGLEQSAAVSQAGQVVAGHRTPQRLGRLTAVGHVAYHEAVGAILGVRFARRVQWRDQATAPVAAAVGALAPSLVHAPAAAVSLVQTVQGPGRIHRVTRVEDRVGLADRGGAVAAGDARDTRVPVARSASIVQGHQCVVGQAGDDGVDPGLALAQFAFALHAQCHVAEHRHQALLVQLQKGQRQDATPGVRGGVGAYAKFPVFADHAVGTLEGLYAAAQVGRHAFECGVQIAEIPVARQRHQQLGAQRVHHQDLAVDAGLQQADRCDVEKLDQSLVVFLDRGVHGIRPGHV